MEVGEGSNTQSFRYLTIFLTVPFTLGSTEKGKESGLLAPNQLFSKVLKIIA